MQGRTVIAARLTGVLLCAASLCGALVVAGPAPSRIRGAVTDSEGQPLSGVEVRLTRRTGPFDVLEARAETGQDGRYELRPVDHDRYELWFRRDGFGLHTILLATWDGEQLEADVVLRRAGVLWGRVLDREGRMLDGARVLLRRADGDVLMEVPVTHDRTGHYEITGLPPGQYWLTALAEGLAPETLPHRIQLGPELATSASFRLGPGGRLRIYARDGQGAPLAHRAVELQRVFDGGALPLVDWDRLSVDRPPTYQTDAAGVVEIPRLESGRYCVRLHGQSACGAEIEIRDGRNAELELEPRS
jgi:hypothetical protein